MNDPAEQPDIGTITGLLRRASAGDTAADGELWALIYQQLRALAVRQMQQERAGHVLQATALVNEAWMRIDGLQEVPWRDRRHFFGSVANVMRRVLVDLARQIRAHKRGGGQTPIDLPPEFHAEPDKPEPLDLLALNEALEQLAALDPRQARIVELRFFAGRTVKEIAVLLDLSERTVEGDWKMARSTLRRLLTPDAP